MASGTPVPRPWEAGMGEFVERARSGRRRRLSSAGRGIIGALVAVSVLLAGPSGHAQGAQRYALLVGVAEYPSLPARSQLPGTRNDVQLYHRVLRERGFRAGNVRMLADGIPGGRLPTRAAIIAGFEELEKKAAKGDFVFLLFAGHGSQQPARNLGPGNPEPDGLDETFMPRDIGKWDSPTATVVNAIVDDEFNEWFSRIRNKGAFVWAVFTTCHSGSVTRGFPARVRALKPQELGVPAAAMERAKAQAKKLFGAPQSDLAQAGGSLEGGVRLTPDAGGFVAFEAVQSYEEELEEQQPAGSPNGRDHGRLAYVLAEVLAMNRSMSYRQAGQQLLQIYAARNYHNTTPLFEGPSLDATVFGDTVVERKPQWPIASSGGEIRVDAGSLHQIGEGAVFAVMPDATAADGKALGYLQAKKVGIYESTLGPVAHGKKAKIDPGKIPASAFARLVNANLSIALGVSLPPESKTLTANEARVKPALDKLATQVIPGLRVEWKRPGAVGDIRLLIKDDQLWLMRPGAELVREGPAKTHSITLASKSEQEIIAALSDNLRKIGRVVNLARLASRMSATPLARAVDFQIELIRGGKASKVAFSSVPTFRDGDQLDVTIRNSHERSVDVTILAIDRNYKIDVLFPSRAGDSNRVEAKSQPLKLPRLVLEAATPAQEAILFIVTEAKALGERTDFSFLEQSELPRTRGAGAGGNDLMDALVAIGFQAERTRAVKVSTATTETTAMQLFRFNSIPKAGGAAKP